LKKSSRPPRQKPHTRPYAQGAADKEACSVETRRRQYFTSSKDNTPALGVAKQAKFSMEAGQPTSPAAAAASMTMRGQRRRIGYCELPTHRYHEKQLAIANHRELHMPRSLAFKLTYNDGTFRDHDDNSFVGFRGACSRDLIAHNVPKHVWCGQPENQCRQFFDNGMVGRYPRFPCMESELFEHWQFNGGMWHNGPRKGRLIEIGDTDVGKIAILTTRRPEQEESERKIIGLYEVGRIDNTTLVAHQRRRIRLRRDEADLFDFWRYYRNSSGEPFWGTMLFRYLEDSQVHRVLFDMSSALTGASKQIADELIEQHFAGLSPPTHTGYLRPRPINKEAALRRKYPGGEGKDHLQLKMWIAKNPSVIGLNSAKAHVEHLFVSGDCVDVAFELANGDWVVVEIETNVPYPGAHQALKYRSLIAAQQRWNLDSTKAKAVLVAWKFDERTLDFCAQYGIEAWACRVESNRGTRHR
jgi:hypothetical protein